MTKLPNSRGWRGGASENARSPTSAITIHNASSIRGVERSIEFQLSMDSKGGGTTEVHVTVGSADFKAVADALVSADRDAALAVLSMCLAEHEVYVTVDSADFKAVADAMVSADRDAALAALSMCLAEHLA